MPPIAGSAASTGSIGGDKVAIFMLNSAQDASAVRATDHSLDWEGSQYSSRHRDSIELHPRPGRHEELAPLILPRQSWSARDHSPPIFDSPKHRKEYCQHPQCLDLPPFSVLAGYTIIMEKLHTSGFARAVDKLAVSSEPGLSNAQLMLTNHDLKPGSSPPRAPQSHVSDVVPQSNLSDDNGVLGILLASGSQIRSILYADHCMSAIDKVDVP